MRSCRRLLVHERLWHVLVCDPLASRTWGQATHRAPVWAVAVAVRCVCYCLHGCACAYLSRPCEAMCTAAHTLRYLCAVASLAVLPRCAPHRTKLTHARTHTYTDTRTHTHAHTHTHTSRACGRAQLEAAQVPGPRVPLRSARHAVSLLQRRWCAGVCECVPMHACVRACVCMRVRACVRAGVRA